MDRLQRSELELERLAIVSTDVRRLVIERDGQCCRACGRWVEAPALHHVVFRSQGGLDVPGNLITLGQEYSHDCHLVLAHGPKARMWRDLFQQLLAGQDHGITAFQLRRWKESRSR